MKNIIFLALAAIITITQVACAQSIKNAQTETVKIYGNCGMCEKTIETAALQKGVSKADWDKDTKMATLTFDSSKTTADEVLRRIAAAGYDSDKYIAPDAVYASLPACCQYGRPVKAEMPETTTAAETAPPANAAPASAPKEAVATKQPAAVEVANPLSEVYATYFSLKDALVKSDGVKAAAEAKSLFKAIADVKMEALEAAQHTAWMKYQEKLSYDAEHIKGVTDTEHQREHFASLSKNMYEVMKVVKPETEVYYDHCPMYNDGKGANWLSTEKPIKNPYYGSQMLTCGKVAETLK